MNKKVGDGTGLGSMPPTEAGLAHTGGDEAEKMTGTFTSSGSQHPHHDGPQRTTHPHGDKGMGKD